MNSPQIDPVLLADASRLLDHTLVILGAGEDAPPGFLLEPGRLSLGAGEADDVFLSGVGVVPAHVRIVFLEGLVTLLSAAEEVRIDGQTVRDFPRDLQPLQTLSLSPDTHLSYGPVGSAWPVPPEWPLPVQGDEEVAPATEPAAAPARPKPAPRTVRQNVVQSARFGGVVIGVAGLLVVLAVLADLVWGSREVVNPSEAAIDRSAVVLEQMLAASPADYAGVRLVRRDDGVLSLSGFLASEEAYARLAQQVRQQLVSSGGNVRMDAMTRSRIETLLRDLVGRNPLGTEVTVTPDEVQLRVFGAQGERFDPATLRAAVQRLSERVLPRRLSLDLQVEPAEALSAEIGARLARSPLTRDLSYSLGESGGLITGLVAPAAEVETRRLLDEMVEAYGKRLPLTFDLKVDNKLNFTVVSVSSGGNGDAATLVQRGKPETFTVGQSVFGTGELKEIRDNGVVVSVGRRDLFIPMTR